METGMNEMDPPWCGSAVISHTEVSETDHELPARRTSPMQPELRTVAIDLAKKVVVFQICTLAAIYAILASSRAGGHDGTHSCTLSPLS
jgi:hypothetical protein